ncbi:MAG TPA: chaperone modulator CbpM [Pyrinomonadaceae bacterium]|jgi:chaperone modulatory protein CbpM
MIKPAFIRVVDCELDEPLTVEMVADAVGARPLLLERLIRRGLLDTINEESGVPLLPARSIIRLRRMRRLRRDLGVNFAGASIILDLVERIDQLNRELAGMRHRFED